MKKSLKLILLFALMVLFALSGCSTTMKYLDGSSPKEAEDYASGKAEPTRVGSDSRVLRKEPKSTEKIIDERVAKAARELKQRDQEIQREQEMSLSAQRSEIDALKMEVNNLNTTIKGLRNEIAQEASTPSMPAYQAMQTAPASTPPAQTAYAAPMMDMQRKPMTKSSLRIKVLSGDGDIKSARNMALKLESAGYVVERIDMAPKSTFTRHTVFHQKSLSNEANSVATVIGASSNVRPLTWRSIFDLIVVTGNDN